MHDIIIFRKQLFMRVGMFAMVVIVGLSCVGRFAVAAAYGIGCMASILNFYLLSLDISRLQKNAQKSMVKTLIARYFLRYACLVLIFCLVLKYGLHLAAFVVGFFSCQLMAMIIGIGKENVS